MFDIEVVVMGARSRYDKDRSVSDQEAAEARAFHTLAELVFDKPSLLADRRFLGQVSQLLHTVGNELDNGRTVALPVRRSVRGLAAALREMLEPHSGSAAASRAAGRGAAGSATFRAAP